MHEPKSYRGIMVSSTFTDLTEHRAKVIDAIERLGFRANVMETSGARADADVIDASLNMVRDSVAYVGVISHKYGQTPYCPDRNPDRLSITELEFNEAMRLDRPIVLFIMGEDHAVKRADVEADPQRLKKLNAFRERSKRMREGREVERVYAVFNDLQGFIAQAATAVGRLTRGLEPPAAAQASGAHADPPKPQTISNIPITIPLHFLGRDEDLKAIDAGLSSNNCRVAITALHGLRGVGKTVLAAAYAGRHRNAYRATWWIRAETESTLRADLVGLGVRLGWVAADEKEEPALAIVMQRLRDDGQGLLLIYDNAVSADAIRPYVQLASEARLIVTSNAPNWRGLAASVEIEVWPKEIGADFLMVRVGGPDKRDFALALSEALGGLPLAHEQAGAFCERTGISFAEYLMRFNETPARLLDAEKDAPVDYHDRLTVAKTFALAIDEAAKLHPAAEPLIIYAALLAPEPIPLFLFSEARKTFDKSFSTLIAGSGLDEAVSALRAFALIDRETISDERDPSINTDCIRLHQLVRKVAAFLVERTKLKALQSELLEAFVAVYPADVFDDPATWPRARRLDVLVLDLVNAQEGVEGEALNSTWLLDRLASYRQGCLAAYGDARLLFERALMIRECVFGPNHWRTATALINLGLLLQTLGVYGQAKAHYERALLIQQKELGPADLAVASTLNNLGGLLHEQGDAELAKTYLEQALSIREKKLGPDDPDTATSLSNLGAIYQDQGDLKGAEVYFERALNIRRRSLGLDHPDTAASLNNFGCLLEEQGNFVAAQENFEQALAISDKVLGPDHPYTARSMNNLAGTLRRRGDLSSAKSHYQNALTIFERIFGAVHPSVRIAASNLVSLMVQLGESDKAETIRRKYRLDNESAS
ncbi:tetratricopeptide repeat protein [Rhodopseudomonas palustris]|nr:tetratricopeptide repeat protein [Rhodopseudomonas palustris]